MDTKTTWHIQPEFSSYLFWDRDISQLDYEQDAGFIVQRAFESGKLSDIMEATVYYGKDRVIAILTQMEYLKENASHFASIFFHLPLESFRCYTSKPSRPNS